MAAEAAEKSEAPQENRATQGANKKLHGRAFYESVGSPKFIVAPMVDQSEFVGHPPDPVQLLRNVD